MPATVDSGFSEFLGKLRSTPREIRTAANHRASVSAVLENKFGMTNFFRSGSFGRGTSISGHSDVDYFAVIPTNRLAAASSQTLSDIAVALRERFRGTENIRVDSPGVRLPFGLEDGELTEIIPAYAYTSMSGATVYKIPDNSNGWMLSAPELNRVTTQRLDDKLNARFKPLVRFLKAWKFYRSVPISSFYLEVFACSYAENEPAIVFDLDLKNLFARLWASQLAAIQNPGVGGSISATKTLLQQRDALDHLKNAHTWSEEAVRNRETNARRAFELWDMVFYYEFPAYQ